MKKLKILIIVAHPDDAEINAGGVIRKFTKSGHRVGIVTTTNGNAGHHKSLGNDLSQRRRKEMAESCRISCADFEILDHSDGCLYPTIELRDELIVRIRDFRADLVLTHRPNDYHPDHRYTAIAVQDASYMLTVPAICPDAKHLREMPVIGHLEDSFERPIPFKGDVVVSIDDTIAEKIDMLDCHVSQFYEWLPYNRRNENQVPGNGTDRKLWLGEQAKTQARKTADCRRKRLIKLYGESIGRGIEYAEAFEVSEYGKSLFEENYPDLFPFFT